MQRIVQTLSLLIIYGLVGVSYLGAQGTQSRQGGSSQGSTQGKAAEGKVLEKVLLDFGKYESENGKAGSPYTKGSPGGKDGKVETDTTKYLITQEDMSLSNWVIRFNSSADTVRNKNNSYAKKVETKGGETVLGVRIHYPLKHKYNAYAEVRPLYEIMEYNEKGDLSNVGNGVLDNVGALKALSVEVSGRNISNGLYLRLMDRDSNQRDYFMGYLDFVGWRTLIWENPHYLESINQRDFVKFKLYPVSKPYIKFHSFVISRVSNNLKGDFVTYFKRVEASYETAVMEADYLDIDDEKVWGIQRYKALQRQAVVRKREGERYFLMSLARKQQAAQKEKQERKTERGKSDARK